MSRIDHVTVAGADLARLRANLEVAGITTIYGGAHADGATEMAIASFPDGSYLELISPHRGADPQLVKRHFWGKFLTGEASPCAWALRADGASERLATSEWIANGRNRPDGISLRWETADIGPETRGTFFPFLIRDLTDRELRVFPAGALTPPGIDGVSRVVIAVRDLDDAVDRYQLTFGISRVQRQVDAGFGAHLAAFEGHPVILAQPLPDGSWLEERLQKFGEGPCAFILLSSGSRRPDAEWFGNAISWANPFQLGWHLGFAKA